MKSYTSAETAKKSVIKMGEGENGQEDKFIR